jgi:hypothetical protein
VEAGSESNYLNLNLLAKLAVMLSGVAYVIESEGHGGGVIAIDLDREPVSLCALGCGDNLGIQPRGIPELRRTTELGAHRQNEPDESCSGHNNEWFGHGASLMYWENRLLERQLTHPTEEWPGKCGALYFIVAIGASTPV